MAERPPVVLCVEDDAADRALIRRAFERTRPGTDLRMVEDGEQALDYLRRAGRFAGPGLAPPPDLILLDLNMPRLAGKEVLRRIRASGGARTTPVVILTTSSRPEDVEECYRLSANSYVCKPQDIDDLARMVETLHTYWFDVVTTGRR